MPATKTINAQGLAPMLTVNDLQKSIQYYQDLGVRLFVPVDQDVDEYAASLQAAGVTLEAPPQDQPWGRFIMLTDPDGYKITIARLR